PRKRGRPPGHPGSSRPRGDHDHSGVHETSDPSATGAASRVPEIGDLPEPRASGLSSALVVSLPDTCRPTSSLILSLDTHSCGRYGESRVGTALVLPAG